MTDIRMRIFWLKPADAAEHFAEHSIGPEADPFWRCLSPTGELYDRDMRSPSGVPAAAVLAGYYVEVPNEYAR